LPRPANDAIAQAMTLSRAQPGQSLADRHPHGPRRASGSVERKRNRAAVAPSAKRRHASHRSTSYGSNWRMAAGALNSSEGQLRALPGHRPPVPNCSEADIGLPDLGWSDQRPNQPPRSQVFGRVSGPSPKRPLNGSSRPTADISEATQRQRRAMHTG
jgi:hypothetical protein